MGNQLEIAETEKAWLAGVIEGDRSMGMGFYQQHDRKIKTNGQRSFACKPTITFSNQDIKLIERVAQLLELITGKVPRVRDEISNYPNGRSMMSLTLVGIEAVEVTLRTLIPYLVGDKLSKARLIHRFAESRIARGISKGFSGYTPYNEEELTIVRYLYEHTSSRKGGKRNPVIGEILRDRTRDLSVS